MLYNKLRLSLALSLWEEYHEATDRVPDSSHCAACLLLREITTPPEESPAETEAPEQAGSGAAANEKGFDLLGLVIEDDGLTQDEFKQRMMAYYTALSKLNEEAHGLENKIAENLKELFE